MGEGTGQACLPQQKIGLALIAARGLHRHQFDAMAAAELNQLGYAWRIVAEGAFDLAWHHADVEPGFGNIHSTNDFDHGNLPCSCD
jgi:hypothetical protein